MIVDVSENVEGERDVSAAATCGEKSSFLGNKMFRGSVRPIILLAEGGDGAQPALCEDKTGGNTRQAQLSLQAQKG